MDDDGWTDGWKIEGACARVGWPSHPLNLVFQIHLTNIKYSNTKMQQAAEEFMDTLQRWHLSETSTTIGLEARKVALCDRLSWCLWAVSAPRLHHSWYKSSNRLVLELWKHSVRDDKSVVKESTEICLTFFKYIVLLVLIDYWSSPHWTGHPRASQCVYDEICTLVIKAWSEPGLLIFDQTVIEDFF